MAVLACRSEGALVCKGNRQRAGLRIDARAALLGGWLVGMALAGCAGLTGSTGGKNPGGSLTISISNVAAGGVTASGAQVSWSTSVPGDSQVEYGTSSTYGSSTPLDSGMVTAHSVSLQGLAAATQMHFRVKSRDASGNLATSTDGVFTTRAAPDTTPPTVAISAPSAGAVLSGQVNVSASASDNVGVANVQLLLDGANLGALLSSAPYTVSWNTTSAANGAHTLSAVAKDSAGNSKTSTSVSVTVNNTTPDTTPPTVAITAPPAGAALSGQVNVSASASDNVGVTSVQFLLDGTNLGAPKTAAPYTVGWNTVAAANGGHTLSATAKDAAGNAKTSASINVTVSNTASDTTPPTVPTGLAATPASSTQISLRWNASADNVAVTGYRIFRDGTQAGASATTAFTDGGLTPGTVYSYTAAAFDGAGNVSGQSSAASATTPASTGRVIEIQPSNADASCNEEFENVANTLGPGDTLILHGGTYTQTCRRLISGIHGTAANPITIMAAPGEVPVITRPASSIQNNIEFDADSFLVIHGLHFVGGDSGVRFMSGDHITFEDNEVNGTSNNAIRANDSDVDSFTIQRNEIHHTGLSTAGPTEGEGMYLGCNNNSCRITNSLILGNHIHHTRSTSSGGNDGIEIKVGSANNIVRDNVVHDTNIAESYPCFTIYGGGSAPNIVERNVAWNCGEGMYIVSDTIVRNNIIFNSGTGLSSYPHAQVAVMKNVVVENNTFFNNSDCILLRWSGMTGGVVANNAAYCSSGNAVNVSGIGGAAIKKNFVAGGMSGGNVDGTAFVNGGTASAAFVDAVNANFWPATGGLLRGAADGGVAVAKDFNGTTRNVPSDVGAYESKGLATNPGWQIIAGLKPLTNP